MCVTHVGQRSRSRIGDIGTYDFGSNMWQIPQEYALARASHVCCYGTTCVWNPTSMFATRLLAAGRGRGGGRGRRRASACLLGCVAAAEALPHGIRLPLLLRFSGAQRAPPARLVLAAGRLGVMSCAPCYHAHHGVMMCAHDRCTWRMIIRYTSEQSRPPETHAVDTAVLHGARYRWQCSKQTTPADGPDSTTGL